MDAPGVCGSCRSWLGLVNPRMPDSLPREIAFASDHDVCVARQISTLVAQPLAQNESIAVGYALTAAAKRYFNSSIVRLADWIGLNKSTVHGWCSGE